MITVLFLLFLPIYIQCAAPDSPRTAFQKSFEVDKQSAQLIKAQQAKVKALEEQARRVERELHKTKLALIVNKSAFETDVKATAELMVKVPAEQLDPSLVPLHTRRAEALKKWQEASAHTNYLKDCQYQLRIQPPFGERSKLGIPYTDACHIRAAESEERSARCEFEEIERKCLAALLNSLMS